MKHHLPCKCEFCGSVYYKKPSRAKVTRFCSRKCKATWIYENRNKAAFSYDRSLERNPAWKGGRAVINGYVLVSIGKKRKVQEHRLVMEKHLGRCLLRSEIVHHINEVKTDNRIENLQIMTQSEHAKHHGLCRQKFQ